MESMLLLQYLPSQTRAGTGEGDVDLCRGGVNVPWGVFRTPLPWIDEGAAAAKFNALLTTFGLEASAAPAWALTTVADGGLTAS